MAMQPKLTLLGGSAYRSIRNLWMLHELDLPFTHVPCGPRSEEAKAADPSTFGKIPILLDGDLALRESAAINTYLGDAYGTQMTKRLVPPAGTRARAKYDECVITLMAELDAQGLWIHRKHQALASVFGACPTAVTHAQQHTARVFRIMARQLATPGPYLLGATFSAADILFVTLCNWAERIGGEWAAWATARPGADPAEGDEFDAMRGYLCECRARPAFVRARAMQPGPTLHLDARPPGKDADDGGG